MKDRPPLRVLCVIHSLRGGGTGRVCAALANGLAGRGHSVRVAVTMSDNSVWTDLFSEDVTLIDLEAARARYAFGPLRRTIEDFRPDTVLAFNYQLAVALVRVRRSVMRRGGRHFRLVGRHIVALSESARLKGVAQRVLIATVVRLLYRRVDAIVAQSHAMANDLRDRFGIRAEKLTVIHNAVLPDAASRARKPERAIPAAVGGSDPVLLYLGRFKPQKQPFKLLDVTELVRERFSEAQLVCAGDGPLLEAFLSEVDRRGLRECVHYLGYVKHTAPLFDLATVSVLTSAYEGFPNFLIDSISNGVPFVAFDCPTGPREIVEPGRNGYIAPPDDSRLLAERVVELVNASIPRATVRATAERFSWPAMLESYEEVLYG